MSENNDVANKELDRYLTFSLCNELYAVPLLEVKEVIAYTETTPIPYAPSHFKGVINLRGQVISVLDLRTKLKLKAAEIGTETSIVILDLAPLCLGIIVDSVESVLAFEAEEIETSSEVGGFINEKFINGIAKKEERLILLLDIKQALDVADYKSINDNDVKNAA